MGKIRKELGIDVNPINIIQSAGRKIDDEILQPIKNTVEAIVEDPKKLLAVGLAIAFPGAGAALGTSLGLTGVGAQVVGQTLLNTAINGGDVKSAVIGAAIPLFGSGTANLVGEQLAKSGIEGTLNTIISKGASAGATAAVLGKDPLAAFVLGGAGTAVNALTSEIPGFSDLPSAAKNSINNALMAQLRGVNPGDAVANTLLSEATTWAKNAVSRAPMELLEGSFRYDQKFDPGTAGLVDLSERPIDPNYQFTTDFTAGADYGLGPKSDGLGFQITAPPEVFRPDGSVNYDLLDYDALSQLGMDMPKSPNLDAMGGGQGLRIPVEGGYITEDGFIPFGYTPDLGDPNSFINQPAPGMGTATPGTPAKPATPTAPPNQGVDMNALLALLASGQQAPTVVASGQENAADIELMQDIFGTTLSAPPAGDTVTQARELARLLRS
jgi:hypothetical protein